MIGRNKINRGS